MQFNKNLSTTEACRKNYKLDNDEDKEKLTFLRDRIKESYMHSWVIDNMPVTWCYHVVESETQFCTTRFPIGCYVDQDGNRQEFCYLSVSKLVWFGARSTRVEPSMHYVTMRGNVA